MRTKLEKLFKNSIQVVLYNITRSKKYDKKPRRLGLFQSNPLMVPTAV